MTFPCDFESELEQVHVAFIRQPNRHAPVQHMLSTPYEMGKNTQFPWGCIWQAPKLGKWNPISIPSMESLLWQQWGNWKIKKHCYFTSTFVISIPWWKTASKPQPWSDQIHRAINPGATKFIERWNLLTSTGVAKRTLFVTNCHTIIANSLIA